MARTARTIRRTRAVRSTGAGAVIALLLTGCISTQDGTGAGMTSESSAADACAGVNLVIDFATLGPSPVDRCVDVSGETEASAVLASAGISTQGTGDYGDAIVCRVNGDPEPTDTIAASSGPYTEDCADIPSADAYWGLWVNTGAGWDYAQVGFNDLTLNPGDELALLFTINNAVTAPSK